MISNSPKAQEFYTAHCAPILDQYRNDDKYTITTSDGAKWFDVQLVMLNEKEIFTPVVDCDNRVIGFVIASRPEYLFADTSGAGDADSSIASDIFCYMMQRFVEYEQMTSIIGYSGFRQVCLNRFADNIDDWLSKEVEGFFPEVVNTLHLDNIDWEAVTINGCDRLKIRIKYLSGTEGNKLWP